MYCFSSLGKCPCFIVLGLVLALASGSCKKKDCTRDLTVPAFTWETWTDTPAAGIPRPEHPRPDFKRPVWLNLNGSWDFIFDPQDKGISEGWFNAGQAFDQTITVPYPWTSALSGVNTNTGDDGAIGWYRRTLTLPQAFQGRQVHLVVGAADWDTSVYVNGTRVAEHHNGYLPIRVDITAQLIAGENRLVLRIKDVGNNAEYPHGKQGAPWYAPVGGIWQTVYLEAAARTYIKRLSLSPDLEAKTFKLKGALGGAEQCCLFSLYAKDRPDNPLLQIPAGRTFSGTFQTTWQAAWSPENPALLALEARLHCQDGSDAVRTYTGLRKVERKTVFGQDFQSVYLNGSPVYIRGVLVQGYHPQGHYTYPDEATIIADLEAAKRAGYNLVRLHIKTEEPLVLYHADRLGLLVDYDVPCFGYFPFLTGYTQAARDRWQATMEGMFSRDFNHPSIIWWTLFNEDWGLISLTETYDQDAEKQAYVKQMLRLARQLDDTRLIEDHSTLRYDHVSGTDINSFHLYADDAQTFETSIKDWVDNCQPGSHHNFLTGEAQDGAPLLNTEYGPFSYELTQPEWKTNRDISWGVRTLTGIMRRYNKLVGYVFTELYDVEFEHNGIMDYARTEKATGYPAGLGTANINAADFVGFVNPSFQVQQGQTLSITPFLSRWGTATQSGEKLRVVLYDQDDAEQWRDTQNITAAQWQVTTLPSLQVSLPAGLSGPAYLVAEWLKSDDTVLARNYLPGELIATATPQSSCQGRGCSVILNLADCTGSRDEDTTVTVSGKTEALGFLGQGELQCTLAIPQAAQALGSVRIKFTAEMAANVKGAPQTTSLARGGAVSIKLKTNALGNLTLPADRADSRGILSHLNGKTPRGAFGDLLSTGETTIGESLGSQATITFKAEGGQANGLVLYGPRMGRYSRPPLLTIEW